RELASLADTVGDEHIYFTRNQNAMFRHVRIEEVPFVRTTLAALGLGLEDADQARDVRVCTGGPVCSLALTPAPRLGAELIHHPALARNAGLRVHISGCPNSCAQHQIADVGFSGRWEPGPEPESIVVPESLLVSDSRVPMVVGA